MKIETSTHALSQLQIFPSCIHPRLLAARSGVEALRERQEIRRRQDWFREIRPSKHFPRWMGLYLCVSSLVAIASHTHSVRKMRSREVSAVRRGEIICELNSRLICIHRSAWSTQYLCWWRVQCAFLELSQLMQALENMRACAESHSWFSHIRYWLSRRPRILIKIHPDTIVRRGWD